MDTPQPRRTGRPVVHSLSLRYLVLPPILLALLTGFVLFLHSDTNLYMLYSQCHSHARIPWLSRIPLLGSPLCFVTAFFQKAVASSRARALMGPVLSFIGGLLTVSTVEAARVCNGPALLIAYPTGPWLAFDLVGGALVWQLVILPAFFHRSREIILARRAATTTDPTLGDAMRHLTSSAEVLAIPIALALGFVLPSALLLFLGARSPAVVLIWLLFPLWVSLIRRLVRLAATPLVRERWAATLHLESSRAHLLAVYALPILCSVSAHAWLLASLAAGRDDRRDMTRSVIKFIVIDIFFVGLTVLYWLLVEAGWRVALVVAGASAVLGPGAGVCVGWYYRERTVDPDASGVTVVAVGAPPRRSSGDSRGTGHADENTPLLR